MRMLGLPDGTRGLLFDMDGVLTRTAEVHARAWKAAFDGFLERRAGPGGSFTPFDDVAEYDAWVDGKSRLDGVRDFLAHRGISVPEGGDGDPVDADTIHGVAAAKQAILTRIIERDGVRAYEGSLAFVHRALELGLRCAVVSSSQNTGQVLGAAGYDGLFEKIIDGTVIAADHLPGKPAPSPYLAGAEALGVDPAAAVVFEDALAGVQAGHQGGFFTVGVDRSGQAHALHAHGADLVVGDLAELLDR